MERPVLVNFSAIISENQLSVRASVTHRYQEADQKLKNTPLAHLALLSKSRFRLRIRGLDDRQTEVLSREYDSDNFGNFELKIPSTVEMNQITKLLVFETSLVPGLEFHLGSFYPLIIKEPKKIIISDFDKTLCDTKYSTPTEMYHSLSKPLNYFPTVQPSVNLLSQYIERDYQPFILSASPHFYESPIRDWLYQHNLFVSNIFLKDYRDFFSLFDGRLSTKDIKKQGFYKLNQLIDILSMTGIPEKLVLMGDGFESDPYIYLTLKDLIQHKADPWKTWRSLKNDTAFSLTSKQDSHFLTKFYQLSELSKQKSQVSVKIHIRSKQHLLEALQSKKFTFESLTHLNQEVDYYLAE